MASKEDVLSYLAKARVVKLGPSVGSEPYREGGITSHPAGVEPVRAVMANPQRRIWGSRSRGIIQPNRVADYRILRRLSDKAFLINTIITHLQNSVTPFLKPSTDENVRGFQIRAKDPDSALTDKGKERAKELTEFFQKTGFGKDKERRDDLVTFARKAVRDYLTIDQIATELQPTRRGQVFAYWAIDPATVTRVTEQGYEDDDAVRYVQEIDGVVTATFSDDDLIFDYANPRSDVEYSGYGFSLCEQAIDLILAAINTFAYNAGALTEDNLPRGMLLLNGDADMESVEAIEDYIVDVMSAGPAAKWRIPIIPSGIQGGEGKKGLDWVSFRTSNRDQEFSEWLDFVWSSVAALFGVDLEELGIRTKKGTAVFGNNVAPRIEASKSRGLSTTLSFLESHFQKILDRVDDRFDFEFIGYERDDPKAKNDQLEAELRTYRSIDEIRVERDQKPYGQEWSTIPLNPHVVQLFMAKKQQEQQEKMGTMGGGQQPGAPGAPGAPGGEQGEQGGQPGDPGADGPYDDKNYRAMMLGEPEAEDNAQDDEGDQNKNASDNQKDQGADDERAQKSIDDDVIEIVV